MPHSKAENDPPLVHVILLTYQMCQVAQRCLTSLERLTYPNRQIIVVDNDSNDGTEQAVTESFPNVIFLQTGQNLGYTGGNNYGIRYAMENRADYVLILNPDTVVANPGFIERLVAYAEANPDVGIVGPRVFLREAGNIQNTVLFSPGLWRNMKNWVAYRLHPKSFELSGNKVLEAEVLNGVCLLIRTSCLKQIGLFDENIFMYIEDAEMDHRARRNGWKVMYLPVDSVIHEQKQDGYHMTGLVSFLLKRNSVYYLIKAGKRLDAWGYAILSLAVLGARAINAGVRKGRAEFIEYAQFCRRLVAAYRVILLGRPFNSTFGPPFSQK